MLHHNASSACPALSESLTGIEEIVSNRVRKAEEPLIIIVSSVYYFHYNEDSKNMLCSSYCVEKRERQVVCLRPLCAPTVSKIPLSLRQYGNGSTFNA